MRVVTSLVGGALILRAAKGHLGIAEALGAVPEESDRHPWQRGIFVRESIVISKPREEIYAFWRNFENLPQFMRHLEAVAVESERLSHWKARGPAGKDVSWDAEVTVDRPNELIAWRSLPGSTIENTGEVQFEDAPGGRGSIIRVQLTYRPPAGVFGAAVARMFGEEPHGQIADDLRRLRSLLEAGEVPSIEGQPSDRVRKAKRWIGMRPLGPGLPGSDLEPVPNEEAAR
ncbi:cyclase/dehydrase [Fimbriimonas ginsengisoli Gsoil 348]|uniref:Cyclase/dehydrase n=1 Tax=Fimbriimonas ginsengisoli Gsoil 348 TaxID=661478 RepID=A0A068NRM5_FIMGI|nr:cyclase/dehydrase [Fimbriimonas ginsengisoli Gsoil 348]